MEGESDPYARIAALEAALAEETSRTEALNRIAEAIGSGRDVEAIVQAVVDGGVELTGARFGAFFYNVASEAGEAYTLYVISGVPRASFEMFPMPRKTEIFDLTFSGTGIVRSGDITKDPRYGKSAPYHGMPKGHLPVKSYLAVPVIGRAGEVLGGLFFGHPEAERFSARHESLLTGLAAQATAAIESVRVNTAALNGLEERLRAEEALRESESRFALLADTIGGLCWMAEPDGSVFWFNRRWQDYTGKGLEETAGWGWANAIHPASLPAVQERWAQVLAAGEPDEMVFPIQGRDGSYRPFLTRVTPALDEGGKVTGWFGINVDVSELTDAQERQRLLLNELNHRVKNTLATVQSIAFQTLRSARSPQDFREAFEARLAALSQTHNLLTEQGWQAASLRAILASELDPYGVEASRIRLQASGDIRLSAKAAVALGMAFHELATNAAKYGALASPRGAVAIAWRIEKKPEPALQLSWQEEGGPAVSVPERRGFGARLLEQGLAAELSGKVQLDYDERGLRCTMRFPMRTLEPTE